MVGHVKNRHGYRPWSKAEAGKIGNMISNPLLSIGKRINQLLRAKLAYKHQTGLNLHLSSQFFNTDQAMLIDCSVLINP